MDAGLDYSDLCILGQWPCAAKTMVLHRYARLQDPNVWQLVTLDSQQVSTGSFLFPQIVDELPLISSIACVRAHPWSSSTSKNDLEALLALPPISLDDRIWESASPIDVCVQCECTSCVGIRGRCARCTNFASLLSQLGRTADGPQRILCARCQMDATCSSTGTFLC